MEQIDLALVWFAILSFILVIYALLDGFDLGVGILSLFTREDRARGILMSSLGTVWDANETWLVLFGGVLFGAFPAVYALVASALYLPLVLMLAGLIFRAVSFEFRAHSAVKTGWGLAFGWGSLAAAVGQGLALGGLFGGIRVRDLEFAGGVFDWVTVFSLFSVLTVLAGYVLLGSTFAFMRTQGETKELAFRGALAGLAAAVVFGLAATATAVSRFQFLRERWFGFPGVMLTIIPALLSVACFVLMLANLLRRHERAPFFFTLAGVFLGYIPISGSYFPRIVPPSLLAYDAAAQRLTLRNMLIVVGIALPVLLAYNIYQYWVFRGKVVSEIYEE